MFFVSEEFLRTYEAGGEVNQTIDQVVGQGEALFGGDYKSKADARPAKREPARPQDQTEEVPDRPAK